METPIHIELVERIVNKYFGGRVPSATTCRSSRACWNVLRPISRRKCNSFLRRSWRKGWTWCGASKIVAGRTEKFATRARNALGRNNGRLFWR